MLKFGLMQDFRSPPVAQALFNGDGRTYRVPLFNNGRIMAMLC